MPQVVIGAPGWWKVYDGLSDDLRALDDVTRSIFSGVTGLLGPNGAGKTTLIKVILGLVRIRQGKGTVLGHELGRQTRAIRASIGYMPEDDCYLPGLSGDLPTRCHSFSRSSARCRSSGSS